MKLEGLIHSYRRMRQESLWSLLAANNGPEIIAILQHHLFGEEKSLVASVLHERIEKDLEFLRAEGKDYSKTAQQYVMDWVRNGFIERRFPEGSSEERYELSSAAVGAIRFISNAAQPRSSATESRLSTVIQQLVKLAEETDPDPKSRIEALEAEKIKIEKEIESIKKGEFKVLPEEKSLERIKEIINLADELAGDFRYVRDQFEDLNRNLREKLMDSEGSRGEVLENLFAGVDVISESDAGRTFAGFWRLLNDPEQSEELEEALEGILSRPFASKLPSKDRVFLLRLTKILLQEGGQVHKVLQYFAKSLKHFVQTREYLEQRRLIQLLKSAQSEALQIKELYGPSTSIGYQLNLTTSKLSSLSQLTLHDPNLNKLSEPIKEGDAADLTLETVSTWVALSEIDFRTLKENIKQGLKDETQISIGELMEKFPVIQGLGSVVGYLTLGYKHGVILPIEERIAWEGMDMKVRKANIPKVYFMRSKLNEL